MHAQEYVVFAQSPFLVAKRQVHPAFALGALGLANNFEIRALVHVRGTKLFPHAARLGVVSFQELVIVFIIGEAELGDWTR